MKSEMVDVLIVTVGNIVIIVDGKIFTVFHSSKLSKVDDKYIKYRTVEILLLPL